MSEMLGNQYFIARNYMRAAEELSLALSKTPKNKSIKRKLIVCYTQTGQIQNALKLFLGLVKEDAEYIINTDPIDDDCPCAELVYDDEKLHNVNKNSCEYQLKLGILWLYCDIHKSISYFEIAQRLNQQNPLIKSILSILYTKMQPKNENGSNGS